MVIVELIVLILEIIFTLESPEKTAEKVKDIDTSKSTKALLIISFTLIYVISLIGLIFSLFHISDILYKGFVAALIIFLLYCLFIFYHRIYKYL